MLGFYCVVVPKTCANCGKKRRTKLTVLVPPKLVDNTSGVLTYSYAKCMWLCRQCRKKIGVKKRYDGFFAELVK
jgi:hypothetical protein